MSKSENNIITWINCRACKYPNFDLEDMDNEDLCNKHIIKRKELIERLDAEDRWFSIIKRG